MNTNNLRTLLAHATINKWHIHVVDIKTAYLNAPIDEVRYINQIKHYEDPSKPNHINKLLKASYGLPESSYQWYCEIKSKFLDYGMIQSRVDLCVFNKQQDQLIVAMHTDDLIIMSPDLKQFDEIKTYLKSKYQLVDKEEIKIYLGIEIKYFRERAIMYLHQHTKIRELYSLVKDECPKETILPIPENVDLERESVKYEDVHKYQSVIGSLNYLAHITRPEVLIYVVKLSKYLKSPTNYHMILALKLVAYVYSTYSLAIKYSVKELTDQPLKCYTDAGSKDLVRDSGRHTSGSVVMYHGNIVAWRSRKQTVVTDEICCAELYAINNGLKLSIQIRNLLLELGIISVRESKIDLRNDNRSAIDIGENGFKKNSKHYDTCLLWVKDQIDRNAITLGKVSSTHNLADLFTKFPNYESFSFFRLESKQRFLKIKK